VVLAAIAATKKHFMQKRPKVDNSVDSNHAHSTAGDRVDEKC